MRSRPTITVTINKARWKQVQSFVESGPDDRHYVVKTAGDKTTIHFGDGIRGAAPRPGSTIEAGYRTGHGASGNNVAIIFRTASKPTPDEPLWVAIRNRTQAVSHPPVEDR
jgi:hypothetical protein